MALSSVECTKKRPLIRFLWSEGWKNFEISGRMTIQDCDGCINKWELYDWIKRYKRKQEVTDDGPLWAVIECNVCYG
jgi:hypothetical protein